MNPNRVLGFEYGAASTLKTFPPLDSNAKSGRPTGSFRICFKVSVHFLSKKNFVISVFFFLKLLPNSFDNFAEGSSPLLVPLSVFISLWEI